MNEVGPNVERNRELRKRRRERNELYIKYLKAVSTCTDCGSRKDLTFDHLPGMEKKACVSNLVHKATLLGLKKEIAKCEIVCWPCHQRRENNRGISNHKVD